VRGDSLRQEIENPDTSCKMILLVKMDNLLQLGRAFEIKYEDHLLGDVRNYTPFSVICQFLLALLRNLQYNLL
jgi:hypothetical protein